MPADRWRQRRRAMGKAQGSTRRTRRMASAIRASGVGPDPRIPYGPAACKPPHQRPDTWQHPDHAPYSSEKILLASTGASTHGLAGCRHAAARLSELGRGRRAMLVAAPVSSMKTSLLGSSSSWSSNQASRRFRMSGRSRSAACADFFYQTKKEVALRIELGAPWLALNGAPSAHRSRAPGAPTQSPWRLRSRIGPPPAAPASPRAPH